jgi:hypothetical protein
MAADLAAQGTTDNTADPDPEDLADQGNLEGPVIPTDPAASVDTDKAALADPVIHAADHFHQHHHHLPFPAVPAAPTLQFPSATGTSSY